MRKFLLLASILGLAANLLYAQQRQMELPENSTPVKLERRTPGTPAALPPAVVKLNMVRVKSPEINCFFNATCVVSPEDTTSPITIAGAGGSGFLQSRTYQGQRNSPAAGLYVYEYRVSLEELSASTGKVPTFTSFTVNFGQIVDSFDFNKDGQTGDQLFVITEGVTPGGIVPSEAIYDGNTITFRFNNPRLPGGSSTSKGKSSFFFGLVSKNAPRNVGVRAVVNEGTGINLSARAPNF
jgi:hypothetical protein